MNALLSVYPKRDGVPQKCLKENDMVRFVTLKRLLTAEGAKD